MNDLGISNSFHNVNKEKNKHHFFIISKKGEERGEEEVTVHNVVQSATPVQVEVRIAYKFIDTESCSLPFPGKILNFCLLAREGMKFVYEVNVVAEGRL